MFIQVEGTEMAQGIDPKCKENDSARFRPFNRGYHTQTTLALKRLTLKKNSLGNILSKPPLGNV